MRLLTDISVSVRLAVIALVTSLAMVLCMPLSAQNTQTQETKKARLQEEIAVIDRQLRENATQNSNALSKLTLLQKQVQNRRDLVAESDREISEISLQMNQKQKEIDAIQARLDTMSYYYERLIKGSYKNRDARVWYMYILASDNLSQAFRRLGYLRNLSSEMNSQATKIKAVKSELELQKEQLQVLKDKAEQLRSERVAELDRIKADESSSQALVNQLKRDRNKLQKSLDDKKKQVDALNREIQKIIADAMKASNSKSSSKTTKKAEPIDYTLANEFKANKGKLPWPVSGPVVDHYGQHYHPVYKNVKLPFNNGVTVATDKNAQIKAVFDGVVKQIVVMPGYNQCILVQHGDYFTFYCKVGTVNVKAGDKVKTGQVIGTVDTINGETQLHFQVWSGSTPQNPETWLRPR